MSWFQALFGGNNYSTTQYLLSREEIQNIVARSTIASLTGQEEIQVEQALDARRLGDGRISLFQIDEALGALERSKSISHNDRLALIKTFQTYFQKRK